MTSLEYSIVRYVPDPIRGERVNVGVILASSDPPFFDSRFLPKSQTRKLAALSGVKVCSFFRDLEQELADGRVTLQGRFESAESTWSADLLRTASNNWSHTIQLSEPRRVRGKDPKSLLRRLYLDYVNSSRKRPRDFRDRRWVKAEIRDEVERLVTEALGHPPGEHTFARAASYKVSVALMRSTLSFRTGSPITPSKQSRLSFRSNPQRAQR